MANQSIPVAVIRKLQGLFRQAATGYLNGADQYEQGRYRSLYLGYGFGVDQCAALLQIILDEGPEAALQEAEKLARNPYAYYATWNED